MNVLCCTKSLSPTMTKCVPHSHTVWEVILHKTGYVTSKIGETTYNITVGDIIVIPPGVMHDGNSDIIYSDMYFQADNLDFFSPFVVHDFDGSVMILMNMLHKVMAEKEKNYSAIANNIAQTICQYIKKYSNVN